MANQVETEQAEAVNKPEKPALYEKRRKIHPKLTFGFYRQIKWLAMIGLLAAYYLLPWLRWDRGANTPDQAILVDVPARKFYFFFIEIWPQEIYYWTGLLILAAIGLFFVTSIAGRVWCGYACPQTVWTDLFIYVERLCEGDRNARIKNDRAPWGLGKLGRKGIKHVIWLAIGLATGGAWVFYFVDAPTLAGDLLAFDAPVAAYGTIGILTLATYIMAGFAREQVCTYMCPYARFQSAMFDEDTLIVTYQKTRGEPRGAHKKGDPWEGRGHCIDCNQCVAVCPTGIDIREGQQLECITCALCIDACNRVMKRIGLPRGLIRYDTQRNVDARVTGGSVRVRILRWRTIIYATILVVAAGVMLTTLMNRSTLDVNVLRDRNPLFTLLSDGGVRNGYTYKVLNKSHDTRTLSLVVDGIDGAQIDVLGFDSSGDRVALTARPDQVESYRLFVRAPFTALDGESTELRFDLIDAGGVVVDSAKISFMGPK
jgi:cytochrome c oxidase accessory protein FixG